MTPSERWLMILLRVVGTAALLAVVAVFMPRDWIDRCHQALGFGPFPDAPVAEYLARSTSWFYVLTGVVQWWLSLDVRRYGRTIVALGVFMLVSGMVLLWVDIRADMPPWWTIMDGPFGVAMGAVYLVLQFRSRVEVVQSSAAAPAEPSPGPSGEEAEPAESDRLEPQGPEASEPEPARDSASESADESAGGWDDRSAADEDDEPEPAV
ncbi:MAG: hypothetical protein R6X20_08830 [Phycisphaerae bacterium]